MKGLIVGGHKDLLSILIENNKFLWTEQVFTEFSNTLNEINLKCKECLRFLEVYYKEREINYQTLLSEENKQKMEAKALISDQSRKLKEAATGN